MSFVGSEDYIRAQFEEYILALLSSVKYDNYLQLNSLPASQQILPEIGARSLPSSLMLEGNPIRDFGSVWASEWRHTINYAIWMSLTDQELFDIVEPRHPCSGTTTLSLEDVQLRVQQTMQDLKLDEKMASSKEVISRTWVTGSSKVRGAVGQAWAGLDQYRTQRRIAAEQAEAEKEPSKSANGASAKESFVGSWAAWAAEKRKMFQKEEPPKIIRPDIGPAPARPLAQWAKPTNDVASSGGTSGGNTKGEGESGRSSAGETRIDEKNETDVVKKETKLDSETG